VTAPGFRTGVRLAVDVGTVRVGVARCDPHGILASPVETVPRGDGDLDRLLALVADHNTIEVLVGLPVAMSGRETASTADARAVAQALANRLAAIGDTPVRMVDERLTTVSAQGQLHASGRGTREGRRVIDQVAAVIMLEHALETERRTSRPAGVLVVPDLATDEQDEGTIP
jgi:putative Holliday junction resolvase